MPQIHQKRRFSVDRKVLIGVLFTGIFLAPSFGAQLSVAPASVAPGASGITGVNFCSQGASIPGLQFDLAFDSTAVSIGVVAGAGTRTAVKQIYATNPDIATWRVLIAGFNQNSLPDGPVATLFVNLSPGAPPGTTTITISNAVATDFAGNSISIPDASSAVTISAASANNAPIQADGVLNGGSLLSGPVSPGEAVALMGSGIGPAVAQTLQLLPSGFVATELSGITVNFDSVPAPLLYASANQINVLVPFEVANQNTTVITIANTGQTVASVTVPVADAAPALFTLDGSGVGPILAANQDGTVNSPANPAAEGSTISLYMTGAGMSDPAGITGSVNSGAGTLLLSSQASVDGVPATITYAGPAPGVVAGVMQINLQLPVGITPSPATPVSISIGNGITQTGATIAIQ